MRQVKTEKRFMSLRTKLYIFAGILGIVGIVIFFASIPGQAILNALSGAYHTVLDKAHLTLRNVQIVGNYRTKKEDVAAVLNLQQGMSIFDVDLHDIQVQVGELPWVDSVIVQRYWPDVVRIQIVEKIPIAVWQHNKKYFPLDETGQPVNDNHTTLNNLILVVGRDAPEHTSDLMAALSKYPDIQLMTRSAVRVGDRRWNLILRGLDDGITVYLPQTDIEAALERLKTWHEEQQILDKDFQVIDLRINDRLIVRTDAKLLEDEGKK